MSNPGSAGTRELARAELESAFIRFSCADNELELKRNSFAESDHTLASLRNERAQAEAQLDLLLQHRPDDGPDERIPVARDDVEYVREQLLSCTYRHRVYKRRLIRAYTEWRAQFEQLRTHLDALRNADPGLTLVWQQAAECDDAGASGTGDGHSCACTCHQRGAEQPAQG